VDAIPQAALPTVTNARWQCNTSTLGVIFETFRNLDAQLPLKSRSFGVVAFTILHWLAP
jgi:hypothetical protein